MMVGSDGIMYIPVLSDVYAIISIIVLSDITFKK